MSLSKTLHTSREDYLEAIFVLHKKMGMENAFYNKENLNPQMKEQAEDSSTITVPDGVDAELLMKVLGNPEMAALLTSLAKTMKV